MKKIFVLSFSASAALVLASAVAVAADSKTDIPLHLSQSSVGIKDLGIQNPGILPSNPFYFLKEWGRSIKQILTFNPVKKLENELDDVNERVAEIKKLSEISAQNTDALVKAINKYETALDDLKKDLDALSDTTKNPNVDGFLNKLVDASLKQEEISSQLEAKFGDNEEVLNSLSGIDERISELIAGIAGRFDDPQTFKKRLEKTIGRELSGVTTTEILIYRNLRSAEALTRLVEILSGGTREKIEELQSDLVKKIQDNLGKLDQDGRQRVLDPEILKQLPGDAMSRVKILDELRANTNDRAVADRIQEFKRQALEDEVQKQGISSEEVNSTIEETRALIAETKINLDLELNSSLKRQIEDFLGKAEEELGWAEKALSQGKLGEAFGQATSANAHAEKALRLFNEDDSNGSTAKDEILCTLEYAPVCGSDGKTYSNSCFAKVADVEEFTNGECQTNKIETPIRGKEEDGSQSRD